MFKLCPGGKKPGRSLKTKAIKAALIEEGCKFQEDGISFTVPEGKEHRVRLIISNYSRKF